MASNILGRIAISLGIDSAEFESGLKKAVAQANASGGAMGSAFDATSGSMLRARGAAMLLEEGIGIRMPRAVNTFIASLGPMGTALTMAFPVVALVGGIALLISHLEKLKAAQEKASEGSLDLSLSMQGTARSMEIQNLRMEDSIAKMEGRPAKNELKIALLESIDAADKLSKSLQTDIEKAMELMKGQSVGFFSSLLTGTTSTSDITNAMKPLLQAALDADAQLRRAEEEGDAEGIRNAKAALSQKLADVQAAANAQKKVLDQQIADQKAANAALPANSPLWVDVDALAKRQAQARGMIADIVAESAAGQRAITEETEGESLKRQEVIAKEGEEHRKVIADNLKYAEEGAKKYYDDLVKEQVAERQFNDERVKFFEEAQTKMQSADVKALIERAKAETEFENEEQARQEKAADFRTKLKLLEIEGQKKSGTSPLNAIREEMAVEAQRHAQKMADLNAEINAAVKASLTPGGTPLAENEQYKKAINERQTVDEEYQLNRQKLENDYRALAEKNATEIGDHLANTFTQMVANGKLSFKELGKSLETELVNAILRASMTKFFSQIFSLLPGGGGAGGFFGLSGAMAGGGDVTPGNAYLVGESGPEIFSPGTSGSVISNSSAQSFGGPQIHYNIDARGADAGAEQRIRSALRDTENRSVARAVATVYDLQKRR